MASATRGVGREVDQVSLDISYEILEHFSENMYKSPNKAIEELVTNGFDAAATRVDVFLMSKYAPDKVLVWDNGNSMNIEQLKELWFVSDSPKKRLDDRTVATRSGNRRKIIGKFGIGKLASYILGHSISHLCRIASGYYLVEIDYNDVTSELKHKARYKSPILELSEDEAVDLVKGLFAELPANFDDLVAEPSWTLAIVSDLKRDDLYEGRLRWVLGNGMPLRPDFDVFVNLAPVTSRLGKVGARKEWDFLAPDLQQAVKTEFGGASAGNSGIMFGEEPGLDPERFEANIPYVQLPLLGKVWGRARFYADSLERSRQREENPRSHGFFLMVRGRLINPDDDKVFLGDPHFGTFYRTQVVLHVDSIDEDLLADRERFKADKGRTRELKNLQHALMTVARAEYVRLMAEHELEVSPASRLPVMSREHFFEPMTALWAAQTKDEDAVLEVRNPAIERRLQGDEEPVASLTPNGTGFSVNVGHPFIQALQKHAGKGRKGAELTRFFEVLAVSEALFAGYLWDSRFPPEQVRQVLAWRDGLLRQLANVSRTSTEQLAAELTAASYQGDAEFEEAIAACLDHIGFKAIRDGASGKKDGVIHAFAGDGTYRLTFEAKGTRQRGKDGKEVPLGVAEARVSNADAHRKGAKAEHAVIVARKFAGFERAGEGPPMILQECNAAGGRVSIMEVEALIELMRAQDRYLYPLDLLKPILTTVEAPADKLTSIGALESPLDTFDYHALLERIWSEQGSTFAGSLVPWKVLFYGHYRVAAVSAEIAFAGKSEDDEIDEMAMRSVAEERFRMRLLALSRLAPGYFILQDDEVGLKASPQRVVEVVARGLRLFEDIES